jgi:serine kinase of HPr protein (carbohydrate metabolism regulator)
MSDEAEAALIHATCVAIAGHAVLLVGPSGSGKSDLALRLIDRGAQLVSDDQTHIRPTKGQLLARAPATIVGKIEVRGLGIIDMPCVADITVMGVVELTDKIERYPLSPLTIMIAGVELPLMKVAPFESSAPIKVELMLHMLRQAYA